MRLIAAFSTLCFALLAAAQLPDSPDSEIPKLAPPLPELPPTFWEQHGLAMVVGGVVGAILGAVVVWLLLRPKPAVLVPPAVRARQALEELRQRPEDGAVLSRVSQILRRYFSEVFELQAAELTTTEFEAALAGSGKAGGNLAAILTEFLRRADERKFSPATVEPSGAVAQALDLVAQAEARLEQLQAASLSNPGEKPRA